MHHTPALVTAQRTRNLVATASLLRSANGLLETVAKIEKTKAEELKAQQATDALSPAAVRESLDRKLVAHAERLR